MPVPEIFRGTSCLILDCCFQHVSHSFVPLSSLILQCSTCFGESHNRWKYPSTLINLCSRIWRCIFRQKSRFDSGRSSYLKTRGLAKVYLHEGFTAQSESNDGRLSNCKVEDSQLCHVNALCASVTLLFCVKKDYGKQLKDIRIPLPGIEPHTFFTLGF